MALNSRITTASGGALRKSDGAQRGLQSPHDGLEFFDAVVRILLRTAKAMENALPEQSTNRKTAQFVPARPDGSDVEHAVSVIPQQYEAVISKIAAETPDGR
jgi:hypothetical protein